MRLLLDRGGDTKYGQLLHYTLKRKWKSDMFEVLELLIERGASLNTPIPEDSSTFSMLCFMPLGSPLHTAVELGNVDVVRYLLSKGADQSVRDTHMLLATAALHVFTRCLSHIVCPVCLTFTCVTRACTHLPFPFPFLLFTLEILELR